MKYVDYVDQAEDNMLLTVERCECFLCIKAL